MSLLKGGIGQRTGIIFALPLLVATLMLGYSFTNRYMADRYDALLERGELMTKHLAALSEFGMYSEDIEELRRQALTVLREDDVAGVEIHNLNGDHLVRLGDSITPVPADKTLTFTAPILRTGVPVSDFDTDGTAPGHNSGLHRVGSVFVSVSTLPMLQERRSILFTGITFTANGLLLSLLLALVVSRSVAGPIVRLTETVRKLTGGNLDARSATGSPGELGTLETGINQMASALEHAQMRLQQKVAAATAELQQTVSMLETRNAEIEQARAEAFNAATVKSEFLARMSHEIRTPLSAVIGYAELLHGSGLDENQQEHVRTISQAASQLLQIIDDILGYARLEANTLSVESQPFDLHETLENVISILSGQAHEKRLELVLYIHSDVPRTLISDANRISQIITNLVTNAIKFTDQGHVLVEVSVLESASDSARLGFAVTDSGIGIESSKQTAVFDPFFQADATASRKYGGAGLGLTICQQLARLLHGRIDVHSAPGRGATFSFIADFPVIAPREHEHARLLSGYKVVIYDHNPFMLRALRNRFFTWGATVFNIPDRDRLCSMLEADAGNRTSCDLLVMGLSHDEFDSLPAADWLTDVRRFCAAPAIVLIGSDHVPVIDDNALPQTQILSKPPRSERLLRTVRSLLDIPEQVPAGQAHTGRNAASSAPDLGGLHVLIAEDNPFNQQLFLRLLLDHSIEATLASNGQAAVELAGQHDYDIIFMDIHMPVLGGLEATQVIRQGRNRETPVIALTADVSIQDHGQIGTGFDDIIYKPVTAQRLISMIRRWCLAQKPDGGAQHEAFAMPPDFQQRLQRELARLVAGLRAALAQDDRQQVSGHIHQIKGISGYFELPEVGIALQALRAAIADNATDRITAALEQLERQAGIADATAPVHDRPAQG